MSDARQPSRVGQTLVKGHTLRHEGMPYAVDERGLTVRVAGRYGRGLCSCDVLSPLLDSHRQRKDWHAQHKAEVSQSGPSGERP